MELREKIAELLCDRLLSNGNQVTEGECVSYAAEVLDIPEIKEALASRRFITVDEVRAQMTAPPDA